MPQDTADTPPAGDEAGPTGDTDGDGTAGLILDVGAMPDVGVDRTCEGAIDVVFVLDVSTTMGAYVDQVAAQIEEVDAALQARDPSRGKPEILPGGKVDATDFVRGRRGLRGGGGRDPSLEILPGG